MTRRSVFVAQVLWPTFLVAAVLEMVVFSVVDPNHLQIGSWQPDAMTVYSLSFLVFWALAAAGTFLSYWMTAAVPRSTGRRTRRGRRLAHHAHG
ncbi:hypothetical protein [Aquabacterium fontiphilum]|uniref:hypothetical protein n=1 Tax=Aquabacterium fontiphilum TaxID=450365 RepID=UPI00191BE22A|nr:hypothetical protein [Aquabacterium fontiphilum]